MIVPKNKVTTTTDLNPPTLNISESEEVGVKVDKNPLSEVYWAMKRAILSIKENENDPDSLPYFKTVAMDTGQFNRLVLADNTETEIPLPAVFVHFINIRYLVQQNRIGEGRATMRVRYVTNVVNNNDPSMETLGFDLFQKINMAIQDAKNHEEHLNERCQLTYFDTPETTNMLQAYWIDYEIWFRETSAWEYRDWKKVHVVAAPFVNHSDKPEHNTDEHEDHETPTYDDVSSFGEDPIKPTEDKQQTLSTL